MRGPSRLFSSVVLAGFALAGGCNCGDTVRRDAGTEDAFTLPDVGPPDAAGPDVRDMGPVCEERVLCCSGVPPGVDEACCDFGCIL